MIKRSAETLRHGGVIGCHVKFNTSSAEIKHCRDCSRALVVLTLAAELRLALRPPVNVRRRPQTRRSRSEPVRRGRGHCGWNLMNPLTGRGTWQSGARGVTSGRAVLLLLCWDRSGTNDWRYRLIWHATGLTEQRRHRDWKITCTSSSPHQSLRRPVCTCDCDMNHIRCVRHHVPL